MRFYSDASFLSIANWEQKLLPFMKHYEEKMVKVKAIKSDKRCVSLSFAICCSAFTDVTTLTLLHIAQA